MDGRATDIIDVFLQRRRKALSDVVLDAAARAALEAVRMWGGEVRAITYLLVGGVDKPCISFLSRRLGLWTAFSQTESVKGFDLLNRARQIVLSDPSAKVLTVEGGLRQLHPLPDQATSEDIFAASLYGAAVVTGSSSHAYFQIIGGKSMPVLTIYQK